MKEGLPVSHPTDEEVIDFWVTIWPELVEGFDKGELVEDEIHDSPVLHASDTLDIYQ